MLLTFFIGIILILILLLYKYSTRNNDYWKKRNVYYIKPVPFLGSIYPLFLMKTTIGEWLWKHFDRIDGDFFGIFIFDQPILVIKSPHLVKAIFQKDFCHFDDRTAVLNTNDPVMDNLIFFKKNPSWKTVRAKISPVFTSGKLKAMFPLILKESFDMTDYIAKFANIPNVDAKEISAKYSTNVIARCAFAVEAKSFQNENAEFRDLTRQMFGYRLDTALRQFGSWYTPNLIRIFQIQFFHEKIMTACKRIFTDVLRSRLCSTNLRGNDLVDILIEANRSNDAQFSEDAMVGHAIMFLGAGFETVSSSLSFALYELAIHPDKQERLRKEIIKNMENENSFTYNAIHDMKYLDMVVSETLRKYPVLPFLDRICKADYKIEGSDFVIKKGTPVYIPMFAFHYHPKYFPDPEKFDPERFFDKTEINNEGMYYFPFGEGPRNCIGGRFGLMGVKTGLSAILLKYRVEKSDRTPIPIEYEPKSIIHQSKVGIPIKFVPL